jgi:uncharacterized membrane protein YoaK (UPF0700 family)
MGSRGAAAGGTAGSGDGRWRGWDAAGGPHQALLLTLLTLTAGCGDGIAYLALDRVFTANMTGNTVLLGLAAAGGLGSSAAGPSVALGGFAVGVAAGTLVAGAVRAARGGARPWSGTWPAGVTATLMAQLGVLLAFATWLVAAGTAPAGATRLGLIALGATAMGLQSAAARTLGVPGVSTTYVTGTVTSFVGAIAGRTTGGVRTLHGGVLVAYCAGAAAAGLGLREWRPGAAFLPAALVVVVLVVASLPARR